MKKHQLVIILLAIIIMAGFTGCNKGKIESTNTDTGTETTETKVEEIIKEAVLYPEGTLDPALVTADTPVAAWMLFEAYFAWEGKQVTLIAYPYIPYRGESIVVENELRLKAETDSDDDIGTAVFAELQTREIMNGEMIAVQGNVKMSWTGDLEITDAIFVDTPEASNYVKTSPWIYDGVTPIPINDFHELFNIWMNREVIVEGYYHSTTTSTTDYGTTIRIDIAHQDDIYTKYVACEMLEEIPAESNENMLNNRDGVQIRGTIAGESFNMVGLEGCTLLNR